MEVSRESWRDNTVLLLKVWSMNGGSYKNKKKEAGLHEDSSLCALNSDIELDEFFS
jgi:hypothetical protein